MTIEGALRRGRTPTPECTLGPEEARPSGQDSARSHLGPTFSSRRDGLPRRPAAMRRLTEVPWAGRRRSALRRTGWRPPVWETGAAGHLSQTDGHIGTGMLGQMVCVAAWCKALAWEAFAAAFWNSPQRRNPATSGAFSGGSGARQRGKSHPPRAGDAGETHRITRAP